MSLCFCLIGHHLNGPAVNQSALGCGYFSSVFLTFPLLCVVAGGQALLSHSPQFSLRWSNQLFYQARSLSSRLYIDFKSLFNIWIGNRHATSKIICFHFGEP